MAAGSSPCSPGNALSVPPWAFWALFRVYRVCLPTFGVLGLPGRSEGLVWAAAVPVRDWS